MYIPTVILCIGQVVLQRVYGLFRKCYILNTKYCTKNIAYAQAKFSNIRLAKSRIRHMYIHVYQPQRGGPVHPVLFSKVTELIN